MNTSSPHSTSIPIARRARAARPPRGAHRGVTMVECMVSLVICSGLLSAVAVAFRTSFSAVELNDQFSRATQASRVTMNHLLSEVRRATSVQVSADRTQLDVIRGEAARPPNEVYRSYKYDGAGRKMTLQVFYQGGTSGPVYTLASNVEGASFGPGETAPNSTVVVRVPVVIEVKVDKCTILLNGTAAPRQALKY
jgi:type II secretory pathway pseudopilin PulG